MAFTIRVTMPISCCLTTELSGQARRPFRAAEHTIHCEDGAATIATGPLERVVSHHP